MNETNAPFGTIEGTQQFLSQLSGKIDEVLADAQLQLASSTVLKARQRVQTWQLILYTIKKLSDHITNSRKLMEDLNAMKSLLDENGDTVLAEPAQALHRAAGLPYGCSDLVRM